MRIVTQNAPGWALWHSSGGWVLLAGDHWADKSGYGN